MKLYQQGFNVDVVPTSIGPLVAMKIRDDYRRKPSMEPIVIIGHSMGGRECCYLSHMLQDFDIPVKLIVILDGNSQSTVPANVARCVNLYTTNQLGIFHGTPVRGETCSSEVINIDVTKVPRPRSDAGIDHFNIHESEWIQGIVISEVLWACPPRSTAMLRPQQVPIPLHDKVTPHIAVCAGDGRVASSR
jgi:hypothetical protein